MLFLSLLPHSREMKRPAPAPPRTSACHGWQARSMQILARSPRGLGG